MYAIHPARDNALVDWPNTINSPPLGRTGLCFATLRMFGGLQTVSMYNASIELKWWRVLTSRLLQVGRLALVPQWASRLSNVPFGSDLMQCPDLCGPSSL